MCLDKVTEITNKKRKGWKVFGLDSGELRSQYFGSWRHNSAIPTNTWIEDPTVGKIGDLGYPAGFHIYTNKEDAVEVINTLDSVLALRRTRFRKVVAEGIQRVNKKMARVAVARDMYIEAPK